MAETEAPDELTGTQRAAILLMSLGEQEAAEVLKHMGAKDVQKVGAAMATINKVTKVQAEEVIDDFVSMLDEQTSLGVGADDYIRKVLVNALGEDKAGGIIDRILLGRNTKGLEALKFFQFILPDSKVNLTLTYKPDKQKLYFSYQGDSGKYSSGRIVFGSFNES